MELVLVNSIIALSLLLIAWEALRIFFYTQKGVLAGKRAQRVERLHKDPKKRILIIGDCGTVSVGVSDPKYSIVGRLRKDFPDAEIVNASKNSMSLRYLEKRLRQMQQERFDIILMHTGSIDALLFTPIPILRRLLVRIHEHATNMGTPTVVLTSPCNLGSCPLFRFPLNHLYDKRSKLMTKLFSEISETHQSIHVPLYEPRTSDSLRYPESLFSPDLIHPNDEGHGVWYEKMKAGLLNNSSNFYA